MPYKSEAQRKYFNVNRKKLEAQGVDVDEWNEASKGKKMPERVKESEIAKLAALSANEINDMDTTSGALADFIPVSSSRRSGRSRLMAESADFPAPYRINRPATSTLTDSFLGSLAGGAIGGPTGAVGGAGVGYLLNKLIARGQKKNINEAYEDQRLSGELKSPTKPEGILSTLLNPAMRIGEQQAYGAIKADRNIPNVSKIRAALEAAQIPVNPAAGLASIPTSIYDTATALTSTDNDLDDRKSQRLSKAGSFTTISKLAEKVVYKSAIDSTLLGAGIGGLAGGLGGLAINPGVDSEGKRRSRLRNALLGTLSGAGVGAGVGYMNRPVKPTPSEIGNNLFNEEVAKYKDFKQKNPNPLSFNQDAAEYRSFKQKQQNPFPTQVPYKQNVANPFEVGTADDRYVYGPHLAAEMAARRPMTRITNPIPLTSDKRPGNNIADPFEAAAKLGPAQQAKILKKK